MTGRGREGAGRKAERPTGGLDPDVRWKLSRIRQDEKKPRVLDLFSGCGGLALGFDAAGFETLGFLEIDPFAAGSFARNLLKSAKGGFASLSRPHDITRTTPAEALKAFGIRSRPSRAVDVLVGGPPCQAFARVGRAKLREVFRHPEAFLGDERAALYAHYIEFVRVLRPLVILIENVPDILNFGGKNIAHEVSESLSAIGYDCSYTLLNAVHYGVPQMRERMFLVAVHRNCNAAFRFPTPTRRHPLPDGYRHSRVVALREIGSRLGEAFEGLFRDPYFVGTPPGGGGLPNAVTVEEALSDLRGFDAEAEFHQGLIRRGANRFETPVPYGGPAGSPYQRVMRMWPRFEAPEEGVRDHLIRCLPRDFKWFKLMEPGWEYPQLFDLADAKYERYALPGIRKVHNAKGIPMPERGTKAWRELKSPYAPAYDKTKFPNKWRMMEPDQPARTLMAHLGKDSYSHIHYEPGQGRTISVREAARLQSFPDGFVFEGTLNPAFRQIGNAVPPLLSYAIAIEVMKTLGLPGDSKIRSIGLDLGKKV